MLIRNVLPAVPAVDGIFDDNWSDYKVSLNWHLTYFRSGHSLYSTNYRLENIS